MDVIAQALDLVVKSIVSIMKGPVVFLLAFSFFYPPTSLAKTIRIGIFDTGFCLNKVPKISKNLKLVPPIDITDTVKIDCSQYNHTSKRFHGQWVMNRMIDGLGKDFFQHHKLEVFPFIVFNDKGKQNWEYWKNSIQLADLNKLDLLVLATSLPIKRQTPHSFFKQLAFVASGQLSPYIKRKTVLWPQELVDKKNNIILVGDYFINSHDKSPIYNPSLKYQSKIDYYFPSLRNLQIRGSSQAVATAVGRAIRLCVDELSNIKRCLKNHQKQLEDSESRKQIVTF